MQFLSRTYRILLIITVLLGLQANHASALDFSGFYAGVHAGRAWGETTIGDGGTTLANPPSASPPFGAFACGPAIAGNYCDDPLSLDSDGWQWGGQLGFNHQIGMFVVGIEGEFGEFDLDADKLLDRPFSDQDVASVSFDRYGAITGRLGLAYGQAMVYVKGGWAIADIAVMAADLDGGEIYQEGQIKTDKSQDGWTLGGGLELALTDLVSIKTEYMYFDFGSERALSADGDIYKYDVDVHTLRVGLNLHLPKTWN